MTEKDRVLVTGACGLLGAHLAAVFRGRYAVIGMDRHPWGGDEPLELLQGDLTDGPWLRNAVERISPSIVVHCAAMANVDACERDPAAARRLWDESAKLVDLSAA